MTPPATKRRRSRRVLAPTCQARCHRCPHVTGPWRDIEKHLTEHHRGYGRIEIVLETETTKTPSGGAEALVSEDRGPRVEHGQADAGSAHSTEPERPSDDNRSLYEVPEPVRAVALHELPPRPTRAERKKAKEAIAEARRRIEEAKQSA